MASNRPEWIVAVQAIWRLGAAAVLFSPAWKQAEAEHALAITKPAHAVGDHPVLAGLMPMLHLDEPITPEVSRYTEPDPAADAVLVFSSGTTGLPKAVRHTHASLRAAVRHWQDALGLTAQDRIRVTTPPSHILGLLNIVTALGMGTWLRLHRRFDLDRMLAHIEADRITVEMAVAPIALALASHPKLESYDLGQDRSQKPGRAPPPGPVGVRGVDAAARNRAASAADDERREHLVRPGSLRRGQGARGSDGRRAGGGLGAGDDGRRPRA